MRAMRYSIAMAMVLLMAVQAEAGWFGFGKAEVEDEVQKLQPALGYVERTEVETNAWAKCVSNYKLGAVAEQISEAVAGMLMCVGKYNTNCNVTNSCSCATWGYSDARQECTKAHIEDWPKTTTKVQGVQLKTVMEIYKDGKHISTITEYAYPYRRISFYTTVWIEYRNNTKTVIEDVTQEK